MENDTQKVLLYIQSLLDDSSIVSAIPDDLKEIEGMVDVDQTIRNLRQSVKAIGTGELSGQLSGKGYLMGSIKSLQAALKNLIWQTKAIASGDFSQKVLFLGEYSEAFNNMSKKLESNINEVKEAKVLLELVFEMIPDATMIVSYDGLQIYNCNQAFERITGNSKEDLYQKTLKDINFFKDADQENQFLEAANDIESSQNLSLELNLHIDDSFQGLISSAIIYIDQKKYILSVIKDVTEFKKLEKKLIDSEAIHRILADNANDVI